MSAGTVLILSHPADVHAAAVARHLNALGVPVHKVDTPAFAAGTPLSVRFGGGNGPRGFIAGVGLDEIRVVWHRRPSDFGVRDPHAAEELRAAVGGVLGALPHLNHPADMAKASFKPLQLLTFAAHGLLVPDTLITTNLEEARQVEARHGGAVVVKPMGTLRSASTTRLMPWRPNPPGPQPEHRVVTPHGREGWAEPVHLTQQRIDKAYDVRVTVVDDEIYAAEIHSRLVDWRVDVTARYRPTEVPEVVAAGIHGVMRALRLRYAAWDFGVDHDGRWWVFEVNPNGQWLFVEEATGQGISDAVARALARDDTWGPATLPLVATARNLGWRN